MNVGYRLLSYLRHLLLAKNSGGHGVHSPFLFDFIRFVVMEKHPYYCFESIEKQRRKFLSDTTCLEITDFGTGTKKQKQVRDIARKTIKPAHQAQLLFRICARYHIRNVLELGTSPGITTLYLSAADSRIRCTTVEGCRQTASVARSLFERTGRNNINLLQADLNEELPAVLEKSGIQDLIFIDANHRQDALLNYFGKCLNFIHHNSIIVVDDPYWSKDMTRAWKILCDNEKVTGTIDLYHMGVVFFNPAFARRKYRVRM